MINKKIIKQIKKLDKQSITKSTCQPIMTKLVKIALADPTCKISQFLGDYYIYSKAKILMVLRTYIQESYKRKSFLLKDLQSDWKFTKKESYRWYIWHNKALLFGVKTAKYHHVRPLNQYDVKNILTNLVKKINV